MPANLNKPAPAPAHRRNLWLVGFLSAATISGAALWEGKRNSPYIPVPGDPPTVCYGETKVEMRTYTDAECLAMLKSSLVPYGDGVLKCVDAPLSEATHGALTLFAYNLGVGTVCKSMAVKMFNAGRPVAACKWIATDLDTGQPNYSKAGGRYYQGLQNRRTYERDMCLRGLQ